MTLDDIAHHLRAVRRGAPAATIVADLPFATYDRERQAVDNARRLVEAGADLVKFEGARPEIVRALVAAGIAVSGHLGLEPQHHEEKRLKAKTAAAAFRLENDALAMDAAGISLLILEMIPEELAERITRAVRAPTIGIGAGRATDGQVLVITDVLGYTDAAFRHQQPPLRRGRHGDPPGRIGLRRRGSGAALPGARQRVPDAEGRARTDGGGGLSLFDRSRPRRLAGHPSSGSVTSMRRLSGDA